MQHRVLLMLLLWPATIHAGPPVQPDAETEIPPVVYQEELDPATPIFVRIEAVRNTDGSVNLDRLPTLVRRALTTDAAKGSCHELLPPIPEIGASYRPSLDRALESAGWIFVGEITAAAEGFFGTGKSLGTLLRVVPTEVLKGPSWHWPRYVFMPFAEVELMGQAFCTRDPNYAALPEKGDRVLLLVDLVAANRGNVLWTGGPTGIITLPREGQVSLPERYRSNAFDLGELSPEIFLDHVRQRLERGRSR